MLCLHLSDTSCASEEHWVIDIQEFFCEEAIPLSINGGH